MSTAEQQAHKDDDPVNVLVSRASQQLSELFREEMLLVRAEMTQKGKRFGKGGGLVGTAGFLGILATQALVAACIAVLALALPVWGAALVVAGALAATAAGMALAGRKQITKAGTPAPGQTIDSVKADLAEIKEKAPR